MSEPRWIEHAVVVGGGVAGLLAARVLSDHARRVTIIERDQPPSSTSPRRYAPQGNHLHALLCSGVEVIADLFPGIAGEMKADCIEEIDVVDDVAWFQYGVWRARFKSGLVTYPQSRPALEARLHARVTAIDNVQVCMGTEAKGLVFDGDRVTGARVAPRKGGPERIVDADIVVDTAGRGSRVFDWLSESGYAPPPESTLHTNLRYATQLFERPDPEPNWKVVYITGTPPSIKRGGAIFPIEGGRWIATFAGYFDEIIPTDGASFLAYAEGFPDPTIVDALRSAKSISDVSVYNFPFQKRLYVERVHRFPVGLLVLGDAICSFDPAFGQGMSTAALEVRALSRRLERWRSDGVPPSNWFRELSGDIAAVVDWPWSIVTTEMFRFPETKGPRPRGLSLMHWYGDRVAKLATEREVALQITRIIHLMDPPTAVLRSPMVLRVARRALQGG